MNRLRVVIAVLLLSPGISGAQEREPLITDRPDFTESSRVVGAKVFQIEAGATAQFDGSFRTLSGPELLVRVGVSDRFELRAGAPDLIRFSGDGLSDNSVGDGYAGVKWQLGPIGGTELALMPGIRVPVEHAGDESTAVHPEVHLIFGRPLGRYSVAAMTSLFSPIGEGDGVRLQQTLVTGMPLGESTGMFVEYAGSFGASLPSEHLIHIGVSRQLSPDLQLDLHGGRSLRRDALPFVGAGLAVRLP